MEITTRGTINYDPNLSPYENSYRTLKAKTRMNFDDNMYAQMAWNSILTMFKYDDKIYHFEMFERILRDTGICALIKTEVSEYTPVFCNLAGGDRYPDGNFKNAICYDMTGKEYNFSDWLNNEKIFVFFNNLTHSADNFIDKYAYMLSEIDTSINFNVLWSRLKPVPVAKDKATVNRINEIIKDLQNGKVSTILQDFDISDLVQGSGGGIDVMNLTSVEDSKYIQYLQHLHDSIISRLYFIMGLSISDNGKQAQISIDELNKSKSASLSIINSWYIARRHGFDEIKRKTGIELEFDYSDLWRTEVEMQEMQVEEEVLSTEQSENENSEEKSEESSDNNDNDKDSSGNS